MCRPGTCFLAQKRANSDTADLFARASACHKARSMTNRIAFYIGGGIVVILVLDYALGLGIGLFLARRLLDLMNLIAVWR